MNVERFAGDNKIMQAFAQSIANNDALMKRRQSEAHRTLTRLVPVTLLLPALPTLVLFL